jgi:uncharacterized membrane protein YhhN
VNDVGTVFLVSAAVFAVGDWVAVAWKQKPLEYVCKPMTLACLIVVASVIDADVDARQVCFIAALSLSLLGDVFLMLPRDLFVFGLASFLLGHVAYVIGFGFEGPGGEAVAIAAIPVVVVLAIVGSRILRAVAATDRSMGPPVTLYMVAIGAMAVRALATGDVLAGAGATLFVASDSLIAWNRFVAPKSWMPLAIIVTYHLGQAGLTLSLT